MAALDLIHRYVKPTQNAQALQALALRRYLRMGGDKVQTQWAWTAAQAHHFSHQGAFKRLVHEATKVKARFATANPGFSLATSPLRSLERQIRLWNGNSSVQRAADGLQSRLLDLLDDKETFPDAPSGHSVAYFANILRTWQVIPEPTSAAPGTSDHGQMRAVDFVVIAASGRIVADTKSSTIAPVWKIGGWERKLIAAAAGTSLVGPLKMPYEPWHWRLMHR
jgi:hypothetical protein